MRHLEASASTRYRQLTDGPPTTKRAGRLSALGFVVAAVLILSACIAGDDEQPFSDEFLAYGDAAATLANTTVTRQNMFLIGIARLTQGAGPGGTTVFAASVLAAMNGQGSVAIGIFDFCPAGQCGSGPTGYEFKFVVQNVPEPNTLALLALGLAVIGLRRWLRASHEVVLT